MEQVEEAPHVWRDNDPGFFLDLYCRCACYQKRYLLPTDLTECVSRCVIKLWWRNNDQLASYRCGLLPEAWLRTCAENFARDFLDEKKRRRERDACFSELRIESSAGQSQSFDYQSAEPGPYQVLAKKELRKNIETALDQIDGLARDLIVRHYYSCETWVEMGASLGQTPCALRKRVKRALHRIFTILERAGLDSDGIG